MKYLSFFIVALRHSLGSRAAIGARLALYGMMMFVYSRLWLTVGAATRSVDRTPAELMWYFGFTELIVISMPQLYVSIEEDVRRGDIAYRITRPVSYYSAKVAEGTAEMTVRFAALALFGLPIVWLVAGRGPEDPRGLLLAIPLAYVATLGFTLMQICVGLSAFWLQEATPVHWVTQKAGFVFGGLLFPLEVYPRWLHAAAEATPFSAWLHGCARLVFGFDLHLAVWSFGRATLWSALIVAVGAWIYGRGLRVLDVNGG